MTKESSPALHRLGSWAYGDCLRPQVGFPPWAEWMQIWDFEIQALTFPGMLSQNEHRRFGSLVTILEPIDVKVNHHQIVWSYLLSTPSKLEVVL